ncbi:MAG: methylenetetrahydrofolate reductase [Dehalococcoidales bacterium]|nr:methylenetetrahydrofolate reductase [Dehalococcoidales bacterium]
MPNSKLKQAFESGKFVVTAEAGPLKGTDITELEEISKLLKAKVDALNVTDQQSSVMRLGSLAVCHLLKGWDMEPIFQLTCRDRNRIALQSDLLSASVLGVENCVALTGDLPSSGDHPQAKPVYDLDSVSLLSVISGLNAGKDMMGNELKGKPDFFAGAVVNPGADTEASYELQIMKMEKKIAAGARFFQTQAVYDPEAFSRFMKRVEQYRIPVLAGVIPLKSAGMAKFMNKSVAGICVPQAMIDKISKAEDKTRTGIEMCADLIKQLKGMCQGVHIMAIGWEKKVPEIIDAAGL